MVMIYLHKPKWVLTEIDVYTIGSGVTATLQTYPSVISRQHLLLRLQVVADGMQLNKWHTLNTWVRW
ncbi:unnamed protein product [Blepharisma stoltei]|uniref:FHA domain-containing protein n=1 Tax=Blepharisma stoltei TaxID=1481888 RepID=A0AAU9JWH2_9CILI|nr:unnamed protein product [Blepharisma stoltei]